MRILLDECLNWRLSRALTDHYCVSVQRMGWIGLQNGELLTMAVEQQFDVFLTGDKEPRFPTEYHAAPDCDCCLGIAGHGTSSDDAADAKSSGTSDNLETGASGTGWIMTMQRTPPSRAHNLPWRCYRPQHRPVATSGGGAILTRFPPVVRIQFVRLFSSGASPSNANETV